MDFDKLDQNEEIFFTIQNDGEYISEDARIYKSTPAIAKMVMLNPYGLRVYDASTACFAPGRFADCWVKEHGMDWLEQNFIYDSVTDPDNLHAVPRESRCVHAVASLPRAEKSFSEDELIRQTPGEHPGGNRDWVTPRENVYVLVSIAEYDA
jgi:hypothetical protein